MRQSPRVIRLFVAGALAIGIAFATQAGGAHADQQIVGGTRASTAQYGYAVFLTDPNGFQFCGGTLVTRLKVVTAAHCMAGEQPANLRVVAGRDDKQSAAGVTVKVARIWVNPDFTNVESGSDVAVLTLAARIDYPTATIATDQAIYQPDTLSTILGWGRVKENGPTSRYLLAAKVPVVPDAECTVAYQHFSATSMVCAGYRQGGVDACQGDSGGPMLIGNTLVGIASWGDGCARPGKFGVYTRVASYAPLILQHL
jgi:secreted trypsin-like serine protease